MSALPAYLVEASNEYRLEQARQQSSRIIKETYATLYGGAAEFWNYNGSKVILSGPFETGKTFAALNKFHRNMNETPGAQGLMVRLTYNSLVNSACITYEKKVLPVSPTDPSSRVKVYGGERPQKYIYENGSEIVLGGLDKPDKFLSAEFDFIYINQAEEIDKDAYETIAARASGRAGNTDQPQVMGDCNPSHPLHWILEKAKIGDVKLIEQVHRHNPMLYNQDTGEITEQGQRSMKALEALTGIRRDRGLLGLWVSAEGVIYDNFTFEGNVRPEADYNPALDVYWSIDDGYAQGDGPGSAGYHPRVVLFANLCEDGSVNVFDEYYVTGEQPEDTLAKCLDKPYARPTLVSVDSSAAELRGRLQAMPIRNLGATHRVSEGIKVVRRFIGDGHGVRVLRIHPRCTNLITELQSYRYDDKSKLVDVGEPKPRKVDDHGPDALRYLLWYWK